MRGGEEGPGWAYAAGKQLENSHRIKREERKSLCSAAAAVLAHTYGRKETCGNEQNVATGEPAGLAQGWEMPTRLPSLQKSLKL